MQYSRLEVEVVPRGVAVGVGHGELVDVVGGGQHGGGQVLYVR